jgi:hypothetical protein
MKTNAEENEFLELLDDLYARHQGNLRTCLHDLYTRTSSA